MAAHILQVAYYPTLQETRTQMLKSAGYQVTSVLGNDNAIGLDGAVIAAADLIVVGFSASHSVRAAMVLWFKARYPKIPVVVLQFTLIAETRKGNRPSFTGAARPEVAEPLYERFCDALGELGVPVETGVFGARMELELVNDGPVTIVLD